MALRMQRSSALTKPSGTSSLSKRLIAALLAVALVSLAGSVTRASADAPWTTTTSPIALSSYASVSCPTAAYCVAVGTQNIGNFGASGDGLVAVSTNGGANWTTGAAPANVVLTGVSCPNSTDCWASGFTGSYAEVLHSTNGGYNWSVQSNYTAFPATGPGTDPLTDLNGITCPTTQYCYTWGQSANNGGVFTSSNGGQTWANTTPPDAVANVVQPAPAGVSCWAAQSCMLAWTNDGYISFPPQFIESTSNGGASWADVSIPPGIAKYRSISCSAPGVCTVVGSDVQIHHSTDPSTGTITQTTDDGASWTTTPIPGTSTLDSISCASACVAVGSASNATVDQPMVVSNTPGPGWGTMSPPPGGASLNAVSCQGSSPCVAVGQVVTGGATAPVGTGNAYTAVPANNSSSQSATPPLPAPVVSMASTPSGNGYWLANAAGAVSAHGGAKLFGSMAGATLNSPIAHIVSTPDGNGYWLVAGDGGTFAFGDAGFFGSMGGQHLNAPVVDLAPTPSGRGYWLVASDGGIFSFGDAVFHGSMGGQPLNQPVVGISADNATGGYWEVATDGGIFSFGAPFFGSTGSLVLNKPVNGMTPTANGQGYWFVASDGGIFAFGNAGFHGSMGGQPLNAPIVGMASDNSTGGYWLVGSDGGIFSFGAPFYGAN